MNQEQVLHEFAALPLEAQKQVVDFIAFLRTRYRQARYSHKAKPSSLADEAFIGVWQDREDMLNSSAWVRGIRVREWGKGT
jgi:hypothetical protein